jgi:hypothetical protein
MRTAVHIGDRAGRRGLAADRVAALCCQASGLRIGAQRAHVTVVNAEHARTYRGAIMFENTVGASAELNSVLAVFELGIDDDGKVSYRTWELC